MFAFTPASLFIKTLFPVTNEASAFPYLNFKRVRFCQWSGGYIRIPATTTKCTRKQTTVAELQTSSKVLSHVWCEGELWEYYKSSWMRRASFFCLSVSWVLSFPWHEGQLWEYDMLFLIRRACFSCLSVKFSWLRPAWFFSLTVSQEHNVSLRVRHHTWEVKELYIKPPHWLIFPGTDADTCYLAHF